MLSFRFCKTRWVEDRPVADRALEVWSSIKKSVSYWKDLSKSQRLKNSSYECLVSNYADVLISSKLHFCSYIASIFENYLTVFQSDFPVFPFFFDALEEVFNRFVGLIYEKDLMTASGGTSKILKKDRDNYSNRFRLLVDGLSASKRISSSVADKAKFQYSEIQTFAYEKHYYTKFSEFNYQNDRLDMFLEKYFPGSKELWYLYLFY